MESSVQGLRPGAASSGARASPPPALLSLPASRAVDCGATPAPGLRGPTGVGSSGPPRPRRPTGLRAAPRGARGTHAGRPATAAYRPPPAPRRRVRAAWWRSWWARAVPSPAAPRPAEALPLSAASCAPVPRRWALRAVCGRRALGGGGSEAAAPLAEPARRSRRGGVSPITRLTTRAARKARFEWTQEFEAGKGAGLSGGGEAWGSRREPLEGSQGLAPHC